MVPAVHGEFVIGRAKRLRDGNDITIASTGVMVSEALAAGEILFREGIGARVLHFPTVKPLDETAAIAAARQTRGLVTVEEHSVIGGLGEAIAASIAEADAPAPLRRIGLRDVFGESGTAADLFDKYGLRAANIVAAARALLARSRV